jgi:hypothetical protein
MGIYASAYAYGDPVLRDANADANLLPELQERIENQRNLITIVPGEGSVLGVWVYNGNIYAFRNKTGGATAGMYKSSSTGWTEVELGQALDFENTTSSGEPTPGDTGTPTEISGATSGATANLAGISYYGLWETGAKGTMVLTDISGGFVDGENLQMSLLNFDTGTSEIVAGDTITGATSGKTAVVTSVTLSSGTWSGGTAAGYLSIKNNTGTWTDNENITVLGTNRALVNGAAEPSKVTVATADGTIYNQTINPNGKYEFINYNFRGDSSGITMYGVNRVDNGFSYDGTTFIKIKTGTDTDTPEHVNAHTKHLFYSYPSGSIQHSSIGAPNKWSAITGAAELSVGDVVTGFSTEVNDVMSVFTKNNTFMLYGSSAADWELRRFHQGTGAVEYTIQKMDQTFFLDDRGITSIFTVQAFGDFQAAVASDAIDPYMQKKKSNAILSVRVRGKNQYRLYFNDKTGIAMTYINRSNQGIMPFTLKHQISSVCSAEDSNGFEVLYGGFDDGYVRKLDSGTSFDGQSVPSFIRTAYHNYGSPQVKKRFRDLNLEVNADTATTLTIQPSLDYGGTFSPKTSPSATTYTVGVTADQWNEDDISNDDTGITVVATERLKINGIGTNMSLIIKNESIYDKPITLQGVVVNYSPRGIRR